MSQVPAKLDEFVSKMLNDMGAAASGAMLGSNSRTLNATMPRNCAPRSGSPGIFTAEQIMQILALACESPEFSNRSITHWTRAELQAEVIRRGIVPTISSTHHRFPSLAA